MQQSLSRRRPKQSLSRRRPNSAKIKGSSLKKAKKRIRKVAKVVAAPAERLMLMKLKTALMMMQNIIASLPRQEQNCTTYVKIIGIIIEAIRSARFRSQIRPHPFIPT